MRIPTMFYGALTATLLASAPCWANSVTVGITDYTFTPPSITVHPGDTIVWTNGDSVPHTATAQDGTSFNTGTIAPGASKSVVFSKAGVYPYHCAIHPDMHGTVTVQ